MDNDPGRGTKQRLTVAQAADALNVTVDAIRSRIKRDTIEHVRVGGRVYVLLGTDEYSTGRGQGTDQGTDQGSTSQAAPEDRTAELIATLREQLQHERAAHSEARRLLAAALERIPPQLEAPERDEGQDDTGEAAQQPQAQTPRPWWQRILGG